MLDYAEILNLNYYRSAPYTGWIGGIRYRIERKEEDDGKEIFLVCVWNGPYCFEKTPDAQKIQATFPFTEEGRRLCVDWLNARQQETYSSSTASAASAASAADLSVSSALSAAVKVP